jgi:hypothetical protein
VNLPKLMFGLVIVFSINNSSLAVDTTRYALISSTSKMETPQLPSLKSSAESRSPYVVDSEEPAAEMTEPSQDENLMNWTPMSMEALGYDIRQVWRMEKEVWTFGGIGFNR